jgi:hypothetical protein
MPLGMTDKTIPRKNIQYSSQLESGEGRLSDPWIIMSCLKYYISKVLLAENYVTVADFGYPA